MPRPKGTPKTGGRVKGSKNPITQSARQMFVQTLEGEVPHIQAAFEEIRDGKKNEDGELITQPDPATYLNLLAKYAQYFVPKMIDITTDGDTINTIPISSWSENDSKK